MTKPAEIPTSNPVPRRRRLSDDDVRRRHRTLLLMLWGHVFWLPLFALSQGVGVALSIGGGIPILLAALAATLHEPGRRQMLVGENDLRLAMQQGDLRVHYQPEVDLNTGRVKSVEALVRWEHSERGLVKPEEFVPGAEESGLIVPMGEWVLREACSQLSAWRRAGTVHPSVSVAVNVSARQLSNPGLPDTVASALAGASLEAAALCIELTESAIVQDPGMALTNLTKIRQQGVAIALDDFGVGYSSLSQIRDLPPIDVIKLDRSFTAGLESDQRDSAVVSAVLGLTRSLGVTAVAEGVETEGQLRLLLDLGCVVGQGYLFARPQPAAAMADIFACGTRAVNRVPLRALGGSPRRVADDPPRHATSRPSPSRSP